MTATTFVDQATPIVASWLNDVDRAVYGVQHWGAKGDGTTDDTAAIQAALSAVSALGGGTVYLPPTGHPYLISNSVYIPNGVVLAGTKGKSYPGATATNAQWAATGTWVQPTHATNAAFVLLGNGSGITGISFIHNQTIPSGGSWSPTTYGYCIEVQASFSLVSDITIVNASHGIYYHYTTGSGGGTHCSLKNVCISAYQVRFRTSCVNDTMYVSNLHLRNLWYSSDARVVTYLRANTIGWYCGYTDNIIVDGLEFFEDRGFYFENETCLSNTHSLYNATLSNVQFNLPEVSMSVATTSTTVTGYFSNVVAQAGNAFGYTWSTTMFNLGSNNVDLIFSTLRVNDAGGTVINLGGGTGGKIRITDLDIKAYSTISAGQSAIVVNAGSSLCLGSYRIVKPAGAGFRFAGAGLEAVTTAAYGSLNFLGRFGEVSTTGTGSYVDITTDDYTRPLQGGIHLIRLQGEFNVTVAAAGTGSIRLSGISGVAVTGISTSSTGFKTFDTGWLDITEADLTAFTAFGRIQLSSPVGTTITNGSTNVVFK